METKLKTFIRYSGNKSKHLKHLIPHIPTEYNTYVEPFVGSGALLLYLKPDKWIINDINKDLINCWKNIKHKPNKIIEIFNTLGKPFINMNKKQRILYCRDLLNKLGNMPYDVNRTGYYLFVKHCAYMGHITQNNKPYFTGLNINILKTGRIPFLTERHFKNIKNVSEFLNKTKGRIYNRDYKQILDKCKMGDFVFLDPPYVEAHDYHFTYNKDEKLDGEFIRDLYDNLQQLDKRGVKWLMTQADTKEIKTIFKEYKISKFKVFRAGLNKYVNELIIKNF